MKVCFVTPYFSQTDPIGIYSEKLIMQMMEVHKTVEFVVASTKEGREGGIVKGRLKCFPSYDEESIDGVFEVVEKEHPDIIHCNPSNIIKPSSRLYRGRLYRGHRDIWKRLKNLPVKKVMTFHSVHNNITVNKESFEDVEEYNRMVCESVDAVVVHTQRMKQILSREVHDGSKIRVIPHFSDSRAVDEELEFGGSDILSKRYILFFGFMQRRKNLKYLLEAMPRLFERISDVCLCIVSSVKDKDEDPAVKDYARECRNIVEKSKYRDRIRLFDHFIPHNVLDLLIKKALFVVLPYDERGWSVSGPVCVCLGMGTPVIASRIPKFQEVSDNISDEVVFALTDPEELIEIASRMLQDDRFYAYIKEKVREYGLKTHIKNVANQHLELYRSLLH